MALVSLWVPQLSKRWGRLPTLLWGIVVEGALVIVFGFVQNFMHKARDGATLWVYLLLRVGMGVGEATQSTMLLAYATDHFGSTGALGSVMGWQETCAGVGFIVGPAMGGLLDQVGGFYLPFLVIGLMILSLLAIMPFALVGQRNGLIVAAEGASNLSYRDFMNFDVMNAAAATTLMGIAFGSIMPTLAPHLEQRLKLRDAAHVGIAYIIPALVYGIACPLVGEISDRLGYRRVIVFGFSLLTFAFVMMGPIPPLAAVCGLRGPKAAGSLKAWIWAVVAMVLFGIGGACAFVPTLPAMERGSRNQRRLLDALLPRGGHRALRWHLPRQVLRLRLGLRRRRAHARLLRGALALLRRARRARADAGRRARRRSGGRRGRGAGAGSDAGAERGRGGPRPAAQQLTRGHSACGDRRETAAGDPCAER